MRLTFETIKNGKDDIESLHDLSRGNIGKIEVTSQIYINLFKKT